MWQPGECRHREPRASSRAGPVSRRCRHRRPTFVSVVHVTPQAGAGRRRVTVSTRVRLGAAIALVALLVALALVLRTRGHEAPVAASPSVNSTIRLATCKDWLRATGPQRFGTLRVLAELSAGKVPGRPELRGPALDDQQAYD